MSKVVHQPQFLGTVQCEFIGRKYGRCRNLRAAPVITGEVGGGTRQPKWRCSNHFPTPERRTHFDGRPIVEEG